MKQLFETTRSDLWFGAVAGVLVIAGTIVAAVRRVLEILPNHDVPVEVFPESDPHQLSLAGITREVPVEVDRATVFVSDLPPASFASALAAVIIPAVSVIAVVACIAWLCRNLALGRFFCRTNTRLVTATSMLILLGWFFSSLAATMASNGALASLSPDSAGFSATTHFSFTFLFAAIVAGCLAGAFHAGDRLQRDNAGLV